MKYITVSGHWVTPTGEHAGSKGCGKTTAAQILCETIGPQAQIIHFADALRDACHAIWGVDPAQVRKTDTVDLGGFTMTVRELWQVFGTQGVREGVGGWLAAAGRLPADKTGSIWARALWKRTHMRDGITIIPDARFPDELAAMADLAGENYLGNIAIVRPCDAVGDDLHASETSLPLRRVVSCLSQTPCHCISVRNDGSLEDLEAKMRAVRWAW